MIRFSVLGSGSSGNVTILSDGHSSVLIDAGLSFKQIRLRSEAVGFDLSSVKAIFVSHEHIDHVNSLGTVARQLGAPVYMTGGTFESLPEKAANVEGVEVFEAGDAVSVNGLTVTSFSVSHDAADPVSYTIGDSTGCKVGMAHDLGHAPHLVRERLAGSNALILESNYCPIMLQNGPYPPFLQQRIRGRHGHLSNGDSNSLLASLLHDSLRIVILAHISEKNNTGEHALKMARQVLQDHPAELYLALKDSPTPAFEV